MKTVELSPIVAAAAQWLEESIATTPHGEVVLTFRLHADRAPIEERTVLSRQKHDANTSGKTGGHDASRRR